MKAGRERGGREGLLFCWGDAEVGGVAGEEFGEAIELLGVGVFHVLLAGVVVHGGYEEKAAGTH